MAVAASNRACPTVPISTIFDCRSTNQKSQTNCESVRARIQCSAAQCSAVQCAVCSVQWCTPLHTSAVSTAVGSPPALSALRLSGDDGVVISFCSRQNKRSNGQTNMSQRKRMNAKSLGITAAPSAILGVRRSLAILSFFCLFFLFNLLSVLSGCRFICLL